MAVVQINESEFLQKVWDFRKNPSECVFLGSRPAVVDFYAVWCGPCRMLAPVMDELSKEYAGKVDFYKVDTDAEPGMCGAFGISSIPTLLFFSGNSAPRMTRGVRPEAELRNIIDSLLK